MAESGSNTSGADSLKASIIKALRTVFDPEIPVNIYDLGLIYDLHVCDTGRVTVRMTLTSPNCPVAEVLPAQVQSKILDVEGITEANLELVWEPAWSPERMSEAARLELEFTGHTGPSHLRRDPFTDLTLRRGSRGHEGQ